MVNLSIPEISLSRLCKIIINDFDSKEFIVIGYFILKMNKVRLVE